MAPSIRRGPPIRNDKRVIFATGPVPVDFCFTVGANDDMVMEVVLARVRPTRLTRGGRIMFAVVDLGMPAPFAGCVDYDYNKLLHSHSFRLQPSPVAVDVDDVRSVHVLRAAQPVRARLVWRTV
jgi:hypothetical protein